MACRSRLSSESETSTSRSCCPRSPARLDSAFPEFGWKQDARGWVATNEEMTHRVLGVRAERVVAHGPAPRGFLVHGGDATLWTAYLNGGVVPRGETFASVVREIAGRAGVDTSPIDRPQPRDRSERALAGLLRALSAASCTDEAGAAARAYLERRGFPPTRSIRSASASSQRALHEERARSRGLLGARDSAVRRPRGRPVAWAALRRLARRARNDRNALGAFAPRLGLLDALSLPPRARAALGCRRTACPRCSACRRRTGASSCSSKA